MYFKVEQDLQLNMTVRDMLYVGDELNEKIKFLIPHTIRGASVTDVSLCYITKTDIYITETLVRDSEDYNADYMQFTPDPMSGMANYPGKVIVWLTLICEDGDETQEMYSKKINLQICEGSETVHGKPQKCDCQNLNATDLSRFTLQSPRFDGSTLCYYRGDTFALKFQVTLMQDNEFIDIGADDVITMTIEDDNGTVVHTQTFTGVQNNTLEMTWDATVTSKFDVGTYTYRIRYNGEYVRTIVADCKISVQ